MPASVTVKNSSKTRNSDAAEDAGHPAEKAGNEVDQLSGVDVGLDRLQLSLAEPGGFESFAQVLHGRFELWRVVREQPGQLNPGDHQDRDQGDHHRVHRHQTQHRTQPRRQTMPSREPAHRLNDDGEQQREKHRPDHLGERSEAKRGPQRRRDADGDQQTARKNGS